VLPFYVLHQTVLLAVGYFVVGWAIPDLLKYLVIAASSFALIMVIYEFLVRRHNLLRFLFGMKPLRPVPRSPLRPPRPRRRPGSTHRRGFPEGRGSLGQIPLFRICLTSISSDQVLPKSPKAR
jgi:hypothetical protein